MGPTLLTAGTGIVTPTKRHQSREFQLVSRDVDDAEGGDENAVMSASQWEMDFFKMLAREVAALGFATWFCMPLTFALAWLGQTVLLYVFIFVKFVVFEYLQRTICRQVTTAAEEQRLGQKEVAAIAAMSHRDPVTNCTEAVVAAWGLMCHFGGRCLDLCEAVDTDTDAMTPGKTKHSLTAEDEHVFADWWKDVPLVGSLAARFGLPYVLATTLAVLSLWQLAEFCSLASKMMEEVSIPAYVARRYGVYSQCFHASDSAALTSLRPFFKPLWMSTVGAEMRQIGGDRYHSYVSRVPEMVVQGWFSVTALALSMDNSFADVIPLAVSVFVTCASSVKAFYETVSIFVPWSRHLFATAHNTPNRSDLAWLPLKMLVFILFHAAGLVAIGARIVGLIICTVAIRSSGH